MRTARKRWGLGAALILTAGSTLALVSPLAASAATHSPANTATHSPNACSAQPRDHHIAGIVSALGPCGRQASRSIRPSDPAQGTPPLLYHGGPVMMTPSSSPLTVTPIYWNPSGHSIAAAYKTVINKYLTSVASASGQNTNVFSVANEYFGTNGQIHYNVKAGTVISDTHALPASGCKVAKADKTGIYVDGTGYNACLDDAQLQAEINRITTAKGLPHNLSSIYVLFLPKHVESCFNPGSTLTSANNCTINHEPSATYCAYHSEDAASAIYANMPFPVYQSPVGFTCGSDATLGQIETPNGNADADTEVSPTSHEINEAITDPDTSTGWYDASGFENGDECAYTYGATQGTAGQLYNQVISGSHFLTQEEFSNNDFSLTGGGCVQSASAEA
jgi:hypothetical protein